MKRVSYFLIFICILLSCSACKRQSDVLKDDNNSSHVAQDIFEDKQSHMGGEISEYTYKNTFIGIEFRLDGEWKFYTDQQIRELNSEYPENDIFYDMCAVYSDDRSSVSVRFEKNSDDESDIKTVLENKVLGAVDSFKDIGYTDATYQLGEIKIGNDEFFSAETVAVYEEITLREKYICIKCDGYLAYITVTSTDENALNRAVESIFALE